MLPQLLMFTSIGATKSLISAVNEDDERLLRKAVPNAWQTPGWNTPAAVRLMAASPNSPVVRLPPAIGSATVAVFTAASATVAPSVTLLPQQGSALAEKHWLVAPEGTHLSRPIVGVPLPPKSYVTSRSPAVRLSVTAPVVVPVKPVVAFWLISKSRFALPMLTSRSQPRYRKMLPLLACSDAW